MNIEYYRHKNKKRRDDISFVFNKCKDILEPMIEDCARDRPRDVVR